MPSAVIFYGVLQSAGFNRGLRNFIEKEVRKDTRQPVRSDVRLDSGPLQLRVYSIGELVKSEEIVILGSKLAKYGLSGLDLKFVALNISPEDLKKASTEAVNKVSERLRIIPIVDEQQENEIGGLRTELEELRQKSDLDVFLLEEIRRRFPDVLNAECKENDTVSESQDSKTRVIGFRRKPDTAEFSVFSTISGLEKYIRELRPTETIKVQA
ncbi:MAG: hypothetical protein C4324_01195 [Blastocatellia bacterium]